MSFLSPRLLLVLALVPFMIAGYIALARRRAKRAAELAAKGFAPTRRLGWRRHVPFVFFLSALTLLVTAFARPQTNTTLPKREGTVILAFDVSNSMLAEDLKPTRMEAAKIAAKGFVEQQPANIKIGVVAFSDGGLLTQRPTDIRADVLAAIDRLKPDGGTSLGQGIFSSLSAIAGKPIVVDPKALESDGGKVDIGYFGGTAVVLLSDGENNSQPDPLVIADVASSAGVRIFPIGIGSSEGTVVDIDGYSAATTLDEEMLGEIAKRTDGTYFKAEDEKSLTKIYKSIDLKFTRKPGKTEVTALFTAAGALLLVIGSALSLLWFGRVV